MSRPCASSPASARAVVAGLTLAGFALRVGQLGRESLWRDEVDAIRFALAPWETVLGNFAQPGENGPLYHLVLRGWLAGAGTSDFALRFFSTLCGTALLAALFALFRRLLGGRAAMVAVALAAVSPALVWYSGEGKMYALQPLLIVAALLAASTRRPALAGLLMLAAAFVHVLSPLFLPVAVAMALWARRGGKAIWLWAIGVAVIVALPLAPVWLRGADFGHRRVDVANMTSLSLWLWAFGPANPGAIGAPEWLADLAGFGLLLVSAAGVRSAGRAAIPLLVWLFAPLALLAVVSTRVPLFEPRYVLASAPAAIALAAAAAQPGGPLGRAPRALAVAALVSVAVAGLVSQSAAPIRPDLRGASAYIAARAAPGDAVIAVLPYARFVLDHYLGPLDRVDVDGVYTNGGADAAAVGMALWPVARRAPSVWLVETEVWMWDAGQLNRAWLEAHLTRVDAVDFHGVSVARYVFDHGLPRAWLPVVR